MRRVSGVVDVEEHTFSGAEDEMDHCPRREEGRMGKVGKKERCGA